MPGCDLSKSLSFYLFIFIFFFHYCLHVYEGGRSKWPPWRGAHCSPLMLRERCTRRTRLTHTPHQAGQYLFPGTRAHQHLQRGAQQLGIDFPAGLLANRCPALAPSPPTPPAPEALPAFRSLAVLSLARGDLKFCV